MKYLTYMVKAVAVCLMLFLGVQNINAQCYVQINSGNGFDALGMPLHESPELESLSCEIKGLLGSNFKVYDATFYVMNEYINGFNEEIDKVEDGFTSTNYLYVYKVTDNSGIFSQFGVRLKIPLVAGCLDDSNVAVKEIEYRTMLGRYGSYEDDVIRMLTSFKDYVRYMVEECCYSSGLPPEDCGGNVCDLRESLRDELDFGDEYMQTWFDTLDDSFKCEVQTYLDAEAASLAIKEELKFALYYKYVLENDSKKLLRNEPIPIQECVEDSGLEGHLNNYNELINEYQSAFNAGIGNKSGDGCGLLEFRCHLQKAKEFVQFSADVAEAAIQYVKMNLTLDSLFVIGKMVLGILIDLSPIGDIKDLIAGFNLIDEGKFVKGLTMVGLAVVSLASVVTPWGVLAKLTLKFNKVVKFMLNSGVVKFVISTAVKLKELLDKGVELIYKGGQFVLRKLSDGGKDIKYFLWCKILGKGCFVKNTPVYCAYKKNWQSIKDASRKISIASSIPFLLTPIQEVSLFDYVLTNKSVNQSNDLLVNNNEDDLVYNLRSNDPYTTKQQIQRDAYSIENDEWFEVVYEEIGGDSYAKLALPEKWMDQKGSYDVGDIHYLYMPEQGLIGYNQVVSIKYILPQKKPVDEDLTDDFEYKPVTGIFIHKSDDVWEVNLNNDTPLGVTANHPIYSITDGEWKPAIELRIGEEVLSKEGTSKVVSKIKLDSVQRVYNLEVKGNHNYLVGNKGIVVHNVPNCFDEGAEILTDLGVKKKLAKPGTKKAIRKTADSDAIKDHPKYKDKIQKDKDGNIIICYDDFGFPDFNDFVPLIEPLGKLEWPINMKGNSYDMVQARNKLNSFLNTNFTKNSDITIPGYPDITWTFHHHQDGKTMQLVPSIINQGGADHVGGSSIAKNGGSGVFPGPEDIDNYKKNCK